MSKMREARETPHIEGAQDSSNESMAVSASKTLGPAATTAADIAAKIAAANPAAISVAHPATSTPEVLLDLKEVRRAYPAGDSFIEVLHGINVQVHRGEMVAIIGPSGSGKSTLMNIIGCLDTPTAGSYQVMGKNTRFMTPDELAALRRDFFGFIFQRYHLLGHLCARENVEVPAVYAGMRPFQRLERATELLQKLGLQEKVLYQPTQLSGGQQQRVSIARALMNGGQIILADEPTGALDTKSGQDVMRILQELNEQGHTIIIVTHDPRIAACCRRVIAIQDGTIKSDTLNEHVASPQTLQIAADAKLGHAPDSLPAGNSGHSRATAASATTTVTTKPGAAGAGAAITLNLIAARGGAEARSSDDTRSHNEADTRASVQVSQASLASQSSTWRKLWASTVASRTDRLHEAFIMAYRAMVANGLRTLLTMLGIIIGIMAVVSVVALARGASEKVLASISAMGTNTITIYPGNRMGDVRSGKVQTMSPRDLIALQGQPFVDSASATIQTNSTARFGALESSATVQGVSIELFRVYGLKLATGRIFDSREIEEMAQVCVIDNNTKQLFFPTANPLGQNILIGNVAVRVVGVLQDTDAKIIKGQTPTIFMPFTSVMTRVMNQNYLSSITIRIKDSFAAPVAESAIKSMLKARHGRVDFFFQSSDTIKKSIEEATSTFTLMISAIAVISLIVGGIGVMNIMLVSVTERTREIGIRMAVGARRSDILAQFLIEAVLVCMLGGLLGVLFSYGVGQIVMELSPSITLSYSLDAVLAAVITSSIIGIVFGFMPARAASLLNPIDALARE